jgi:hypothetical protein
VRVAEVRVRGVNLEHLHSLVVKVIKIRILRTLRLGKRLTKLQLLVGYLYPNCGQQRLLLDLISLSKVTGLRQACLGKVLHVV